MASTARASDLVEEVGVVMPASAQEAFRTYFRFAWRCLRRLGVAEHLLDDAVQDVFVIVHRRFDDFAARSAFRTWLYGIVVRVASDHRKAVARRQARFPDSSLSDDVPDDRVGPEEQLSRREAHRLFHRLLDAMDEEKRVIFVLVELEELSIPEVCKMLDLNLNTAYARLRRARLQFDELLARFHDRRDTP